MNINNVINLNTETSITLKKRGRKSKKEMLELSIQNNINKNNSFSHSNQSENINVIIEESDNKENSDSSVDLMEDKNFFSFNNENNKPIAKKRGRKPKGGKIIQQIIPLNLNKESKPNIILHLKCSLKDLQNNSTVENDIQSYNSFNFQNKIPLNYDLINNEKYSTQDLNIITSTKFPIEEELELEEEKSVKENDIRDIWKKLKVLEHNLHLNNVNDKKSACFWCTYEFDNPPIYIPKHYIKDSYHVYGCFCSPECATAYLMEENIDSSAKFERYHLLNHIYSKIFDYKKNIKPAPNPFYLLEKYYGNLSIQDYRTLLRNERLFLIVDKPLTRILPELHEDNDDFIINNKIIPSNNFQIKKKLQKKQLTKSNILNERFGLLQ